jgi:phosphoglycolate phosphatase
MSLPSQSSIVVFDFDGTIAKTDELMLELYNKMAQDLSIKPIAEEEVTVLKEMTTREALRSLKIYWYKVPKLWRRMTTALAEHSHQIEIHDGIPELLKNLADHQIQFGIISSNSIENIQAVFQHNNLPSPLFIGSSSAIFKKHKVYKKLLKQHHYALKTSIYVGDETRDVALGQKLSVPVLSVSWGFATVKSLQNAGATVICKSVKELENEFKRYFEGF